MQERIQRARGAALAARKAEAEPESAERRNSWTITCIALVIMVALLVVKLQICGADSCYAGDPRGTTLVSEP
jgi:hypothetical protein